MKTMLGQWFLKCFFVLCIGNSSIVLVNASHVVGGNLEMVALDPVPGRYRVTLNLYFNEINQDVGGLPDSNYPIAIFRKRDNLLLASIQVNRLPRQDIVYTNQGCATVRRLKTSLYRYESILTLDPTEYGDPQGYYMVWQSCCRNGDLDNIVEPRRTGMSFYLEFPPLTRTNKPYLNSSPIFDRVDGEYICVNEPFSTSFDARDPDGDELRYSLVTPYDVVSKQFYSPSSGETYIKWTTGIDANKAIPGNPPLKIDARTGELTVTANRLGLFVFSVLVEEFRRGERIGAVQRDYQFLVVDCPPLTPPDPSITLNGQPVTQAQICEGNSLTLTAANQTDWTYQWKLNGNNILGATSSALTVSQSGRYQLITSLKAQCSKSKRSQQITINVQSNRLGLKSEGRPVLCAGGSNLKLFVESSNNDQFEWYYQPISQSDVSRLNGSASSLGVSQPGRYWVLNQPANSGCISRSDTLLVSLQNPTSVQITPARSTTVLCAGDSLLLTTEPRSDYQYFWLRSNDTISKASYYQAFQGGSYRLLLIDTLGCLSLSSPYDLQIASPVRVTLDSIPSFCGSDHPTVTLRGVPNGGTYSGNGVADAVFDPQKAGVGHHTITYEVKTALACQSGLARRTVHITSPPNLDLGPDKVISRGAKIMIGQDLGQNFTYQWSPSDGLNDAMVAEPIASPDLTTTYQLRINDAAGCVATDTILIRVNDQIWVPSAFSPNSDGINDRWEIKGTESYPDIEVFIYNRWGEVVFYSKGYKIPFDGRFKGGLLPLGVYSYQIRSASINLVERGTVTLLY